MQAMSFVRFQTYAQLYPREDASVHFKKSKQIYIKYHVIYFTRNVWQEGLHLCKVGTHPVDDCRELF